MYIILQSINQRGRHYRLFYEDKFQFPTGTSVSTGYGSVAVHGRVVGRLGDFYAWFQASIAAEMRFSLFCDITQRWSVDSAVSK
jgi:hypothetical protein